jgi:signal transduction histidine kinase
MALPLERLLLDARSALARTVDVDRALREAAQHLCRVLSCDAVVIALADSESAAPRLAYQMGFSGTAAELEHRLADEWQHVLETGDVASDVRGGALEMSARMATDDAVLGAITVAASASAPDQHDESREALTVIAAEAAIAIQRARLIERAGMRRRYEAIAEVSTGVAKELRGPLSSISSAAQLLRFRVKDDPVVEKNVGRILRDVERLNNMATSLLEYGRPVPVRLKTGDPDAVWDRVLEEQRGLLESRALLVQRTRAEPAAECAVDETQLAHALANLLANAVDAAPEGSDLTLHSEVLPNGAWRCALHNRGAAIPPDMLPRVFELFFSTKPASAGIGLPLSRRIIDEHAGTLTLESAPQSGTAATVTIPSAHAHHPSARVAQQVLR